MENQKNRIEFWLNKMEEPERSQAFSNCKRLTVETTAKSIPDAICMAFYWHDTPEGGDYWCEIQDKYFKK
jgi:hypothetical protein